MGYEIDFLAVGENGKSGDATALRFGDLSGARAQQTVVVIDGGFKDTGEAIVDHIKRYYGTDRVDLVVSTHPDGDHANGLEVVLEKLHVDRLWMHQPWNHTQDIAKLFRDGRVTDNSIREEFRKSLESAYSLEAFAKSKGIPIEEPFTGLTDRSGCVCVVGPTEDYYETLLPCFSQKQAVAASGGILGALLAEVREIAQKVAESWGYETLDDSGETTPINNSSAILLVNVDGERMLFTADAGIPALSLAADILNGAGINHTGISFIQVPHHGSKRNVGPMVLDRLVGPKLSQQEGRKVAFVSAAKDGKPKHPAKKVSNAFLRRGAPVHSTQGNNKCHSHNGPARARWGPSVPLLLYEEVDE